MEIIEATPDDDATLVSHYLALWDSYGTPPDHIEPDAASRIAPSSRMGADNVASRLSWPEATAGSPGRSHVSCTCALSGGGHACPSPHGLCLERLRRTWLPKEGNARHLMEAALAHLKALGCTMAVLHSSDAGEKLYEELGFERAKEMRLKL